MYNRTSVTLEVTEQSPTAQVKVPKSHGLFSQFGSQGRKQGERDEGNEHTSRCKQVGHLPFLSAGWSLSWLCISLSLCTPDRVVASTRIEVLSGKHGDRCLGPSSKPAVFSGQWHWLTLQALGEFYFSEHVVDQKDVTSG